MEIKSELNPQKSKKDFWRTHVKQWDESDLSQQSYCMQEKINYGTFVYWRSQFLAESGQEKVRQFVPVKIKSLSPETSESIKIKMASGNIIIIPLNIGLSDIVKFIHQLENSNA